jgi:hypothetical protein
MGKADSKPLGWFADCEGGVTTLHFAHFSYIHTKSRRTDSQTSHEAAKFATTGKAGAQRVARAQAVKSSENGLTAREVAAITCIDYIAVQRRIAECGLTKTEQSRDGCMVWEFAVK